jgi:hypothetical protein
MEAQDTSRAIAQAVSVRHLTGLNVRAVHVRFVADKVATSLPLPAAIITPPFSHPSDKMGRFEVAVPQDSTPPSSKKQTEGGREEEGTWGGVVPRVAKRMLEAKIWKRDVWAYRCRNMH